MPVDCPIPQHVTGLYLFAVINLVCLFHATTVSCDIEVRRTSTNDTINAFQDHLASFGPNLPDKGIYGYVMVVEPDNGTTKCTQYQPHIPAANISEKMTWIALMQRNGCKFDDMVYSAQTLGFGAVIVYNYDGNDDIISMGGGKDAGRVAIPSVFVGFTAGSIIKNNFQFDTNKTFYIKIEKDDFFDKPYLIWPFAVVVGTCFILMLLFMLFKWIRDCQKRRKSRLSTKHLKKIPVKKFKKGDNYETCAICLDDYQNGDKLRVLPCAHAYHCKCIDPWLTKRKKTCPVCKRKVIPGANPDSDSESSEDEGPSNSERTPLLAGNNNTRRSTFDNSGLPEVVRTEVQRVQIRRQSQSSISDSSEDEVDTIEADITMETSSEEEDDRTPEEARAGPSGINNSAFTGADSASHTSVGVDPASSIQAEVAVKQTGEDKATNHIV
ncbi:E3 ubiquitin-protein ligase RNF13-like isoform X1 [Saccostrea cucullata]|uniref:E3 ubiquitin-protein ligase RNF13-like isoform X1 n=2 Tax=Saccostrea cuccullata TaxID=36930 RepID=UPI002ED192F8